MEVNDGVLLLGGLRGQDLGGADEVNVERGGLVGDLDALRLVMKLLLIFVLLRETVLKGNAI